MTLVLTDAADRTLDVTVAESLAVAMDVGPAEVDFCLNDVLDPDALQRLHEHAARSDDRAWRLEFGADGFDVTVWSDGAVRVE